MKKSAFILVLIGFVVGVLGLAAVRFFTFKTDDVHYHADFALYINGQRDEFNSFTFYEEVQACDVHDEDNAHGRAHMHDQVNHVVHVHAHGVTWGHFFANLGYAVGDKVVQTTKNAYVDGQDNNQLTYLLNGQEVDNVANEVIGSEDVLLINYGKDDQATLKKRYDETPRGANKANTTSDPASCSGSEKVTFATRLKYAFSLLTDPH